MHLTVKYNTFKLNSFTLNTERTDRLSEWLPSGELMKSFDFAYIKYYSHILLQC